MCSVDFLHIPTYWSKNKHTLVKKYITEVFSLGLAKPKLSSIWDMDILIRCLESQIWY